MFTLYYMSNKALREECDKEGHVAVNVAANIFFFVALRPNAGHGLLILEVSRSHTTTHHSQ